MKKPTKEQIENSVDMHSLDKFLEGISHGYDWFYDKPGSNHYQLLAYLSLQLPKGSKVVDCGTYRGLSALALSYNPDIEVVTYDIKDHVFEPIKKRKNIEFKIMSCNDDIENILDANFIFLDIDPHDGVKEEAFMNLLTEHGYKGCVIADDIRAMHIGIGLWWVNMKLPKEDWSDIGHATGTGLIVIE